MKTEVFAMQPKTEMNFQGRGSFGRSSSTPPLAVGDLFNHIHLYNCDFILKV